MGAPNDEALPGHRLYDRGLAELAGAGLIAHSERIARLEQVNRVHPGHEAERFSRQHHYIVPLKESIVEVVAEPVAVQPATRTAASRRLTRLVICKARLDQRHESATRVQPNHIVSSG